LKQISFTRTLEFYIRAFQNLNRAHNLGGAPHKPVLLLALIRAFDFGIYESNRITITPELIGYFKTFWSALVKTGHKESFVLPFYHLKNERSGFWRLIAKPGYQFALTSSNSIRSFKALTDALDYAEIDIELAQLLKERTNRDILMQAILSQYFPGNKISEVEEIKGDYLKDIQTKLFNEPNPEYIERVKELYGNPNAENEELELETYSRGEAFKREIPKIYNYTCAITGMRIDSATDVSMVDACHIVPFRISFDDSLTNGIALCPNMHRAFDRGLIAIDDDYRVVVSKNFMESFSHYSIKQYDRREILLPEDKSCWPRLDNLTKHRVNYNWFLT
jgi:putative restriction endonuclease